MTMFELNLYQKTENTFKFEIIINYFQTVNMPYPSFIGFTKEEVEDLESIVKEHGDVDYSGKKFIFCATLFTLATYIRFELFSEFINKQANHNKKFLVEDNSFFWSKPVQKT